MRRPPPLPDELQASIIATPTTRPRRLRIGPSTATPASRRTTASKRPMIPSSHSLTFVTNPLQESVLLPIEVRDSHVDDHDAADVPQLAAASPGLSGADVVSVPNVTTAANNSGKSTMARVHLSLAVTTAPTPRTARLPTPRTKSREIAAAAAPKLPKLHLNRSAFDYGMLGSARRMLAPESRVRDT
jgi:hypothetical protein